MDLLDMVGLDVLEDKYPYEMSGGKQKRAANGRKQSSFTSMPSVWADI